MAANQKETVDKAPKAVELEASKQYNITGLKGAKHLVPDVTYENVPGADAQALINRGYAKLAD